MKYCPQFAHIPPSFSKLWLFQLHATMFTLHPNNSSKVVKMHWSSNFQTCFVHGVKRKNIERNRFSQKTTWDQKTYFRQFFFTFCPFFLCQDYCFGKSAYLSSICQEHCSMDQGINASLRIPVFSFFHLDQNPESKVLTFVSP